LPARRIQPRQIRADVTAADLVDTAFMACNERRLREACRLFTENHRGLNSGVFSLGGESPKNFVF
jgi:hypothetical protein